MTRQLQDLIDAGFNVHKFDTAGLGKLEENEKQKEIILIFNKTNYEKSLESLKEEGAKYKTGILYDYNISQEEISKL